jgi:hypothetical protein
MMRFQTMTPIHIAPRQHRIVLLRGAELGIVTVSVEQQLRDAVHFEITQHAENLQERHRGREWTANMPPQASCFPAPTFECM